MCIDYLVCFSSVDVDKRSESGYVTYDASNFDATDVEECSSVNPDHPGIDRL